MVMSAEEKYGYWLDSAEYDLNVANGLLANGHWLYVAFMCQQAVEKLVKGLYVLYVDDDVPRTHRIQAIVLKFESQLPSAVPVETWELFATLSSCYLNNRYTDYKQAMASQIKEQEARALHSQTKEVFAWLLTLKP